MVLVAGIEPASVTPEATVLSIKLYKRKRLHYYFNITYIKKLKF